jgi:hypothetical protein
MCKLGAFLLLGFMAAGAAQHPAGGPAEAQSAPPEVDRALRERVTKFFQAHVDGKFRLAEQYIAEDSKDIYYAAQKPKYLKFEIAKITYSDHFQRAAVVVNCERVVSNQFGTYSLNVPQNGEWKLENGLWCWFVDPDIIRGPFGETHRRSEVQANGAPRPTESAAHKGPSIDDVLRKVNESVKADKSQVRLSAKAPSAEVVISNSMPGAISLKLEVPKVAGLSVKLDKEQVLPKQSSRVLFRYTPQSNLPTTMNVSVQVEPTGQAIPIQVQFGPEQAAK